MLRHVASFGVLEFLEASSSKLERLFWLANYRLPRIFMETLCLVKSGSTNHDDLQGPNLDEVP